MTSKTTILIIILAIITGVLIFLAVRSDQGQNLGLNNDVVTTPKPTAVEPYATLSFVTPTLDLSKVYTATQSVDIVIDTDQKPVFGAQIELSYNPLVFQNVKISKPVDNSFFGNDANILINSVDQTQGRVSYAISAPATGSEKMGTGSVATLTFTANKFAGFANSQFVFLPKTTVTTLKTQDSVLKAVTPLSVILTEGKTSTATQSPDLTQTIQQNP